jgi:hypothetical protein
VLLAGCGGGGPHLARQDAAPLIELADKIAGEGACAQARHIRALAVLRTRLVNTHKVPAALADSLSSGVNALVVQTPPCLPAVPAATVTPQPTIKIDPKHGPKKHKRDKHGHDKGDH